MNFKKYFFISICFFFLNPANAQPARDSLLKRAKAVIYEQPDETISLALQLLKTEKKVDEVAHLYMLLSNAYIAKRNTDSSLFYILRAADLINTDAQLITKIKILNSVAVQYQQMELYGKALTTLDQAYEMITKLPEQDKDRLFNSGFIYAVRGMIYRSQSNPDLALEKFRFSAKNFQQLPADKKTAANLSIIFYNMAYCFIDLGQFGQASAHFKKSLDFAAQADARSLEAYALKGLGESSFLTRNYNQSVDELLRAEELATPVGDLVLTQGIYSLLASNYLVLNDLVKYQQYTDRSADVQKKLEDSELKSLNRYLNSQDESLERAEKTLKKRYRFYALAATVLAVVIFALLFREIRRQAGKNSRRREITEQFLHPRKIS